MLVLRSLARRLLIQALVSSTVMAGIQVAVRFGPDVLPARIASAEADRPQAATRQDDPKASPDAEATFAQDRTRADIKAGRFPVWRERSTVAATIAPERLASKGAGSGLSDVLLFDRCRPHCESRDPLLAFNRSGSAAASPPAERPTSSVDDDATFPIAEAPDIAPLADTAERGSGVAAAARSGVSWARRMVGTAGSTIGW